MNFLKGIKTAFFEVKNNLKNKSQQKDNTQPSLELYLKKPLPLLSEENSTDKLTCLFQGKYDKYLANIVKSANKQPGKLNFIALDFKFSAIGSTYKSFCDNTSKLNTKERNQSFIVVELCVSSKEKALNIIKKGKASSIIRSGSNLDYLLSHQGKTQAFADRESRQIKCTL